jgi:type IV pilus assembly protein PilA
MRKGYTILEFLISVIILGVLIAIALPTYINIKEQSIDKEAYANLRILQAAQKIYKLDAGFYYGNVSSIPTINSMLKLNLASSAKADWAYAVNNTGCVQARRVNGPNNRSWYFNVLDNTSYPAAGPCP